MSREGGRCGGGMVPAGRTRPRGGPNASLNTSAAMSGGDGGARQTVSLLQRNIAAGEEDSSSSTAGWQQRQAAAAPERVSRTKLTPRSSCALSSWRHSGAGRRARQAAQAVVKDGLPGHSIRSRDNTRRAHVGPRKARQAPHERRGKTAAGERDAIGRTSQYPSH